MITRHWLWLMVILAWQSRATEFIYPVAFCDRQYNQPLLFFVHQKSLDCIELWIRNLHTGEEHKALPRLYIPAALRILPDLSGFSFIHNDALYIKYFNKRSPKRIEFYEPLYGINTIEWIDAQHFYFAAQEHKRYRIYESDTEGEVTKIVSDDAVDLLYPQKIDATLFYIERDDRYHFRIIQTPYHQLEKKEVVLEINDKQIGFLHMISDHEGFFLKYPQMLSADQKAISFSYYQLTQQNNYWRSQWLFDFCVPTAYLVDGPERIYESIVPFIPRYKEKSLYYADYQSYKAEFELFRYDLITSNSRRGEANE